MREGNKIPGDAPVAALIALLEQHQEFVETWHLRADAARFAFTPQRFASELARSAASRFKTQKPSWPELEEYFGTLHLADFALACACSDGAETAWEFFVGNYRSYMRACAGAILKRGGDAAEARDLADSLFAELYGLADGRRSLFGYFHGRSSLKTWLRAVLAQRHIDGIRASRRLESLDAEDGAGRISDGDGVTGLEHRRKIFSGPLASPPDPHRDKYVALFCRALQEAIQKLSATDHQRMRWYYVDDKTLAEVGRAGAEHESSVSRNLERIRRELRAHVEEILRGGGHGDEEADGAEGAKRQFEPGLSDAQILLCFQYATEQSPIDFNLLFPGGDEALRRDAGRKDT